MTNSQEKRTKEDGKKKPNKNKSKTINQMAMKTYISIIALNVNGLMLQPKDIDCLNGYKNKTHIYAVYKRTTSDLGKHRLKVRGWKSYSM